MMIEFKKMVTVLGTVALAQLQGSLPQVGDKLAKVSESYCVIPQHMLIQSKDSFTKMKPARIVCVHEGETTTIK